MPCFKSFFKVYFRKRQGSDMKKLRKISGITLCVLGVLSVLGNIAGGGEINIFTLILPLICVCSGLELRATGLDRKNKSTDIGAMVIRIIYAVLLFIIAAFELLGAYLLIILGSLLGFMELLIAAFMIFGGVLLVIPVKQVASEASDNLDVK